LQRTLILIGIVLMAAGIAWPWLSRLPFGRLPGDLVVGRPGLKVFLPFTTMLLVSLLLTLVLWIFRR
jgi:hypothetical protein